MHVVKRNGSTEEVSFDKIYQRLKYLVFEPTVLKSVNTHMIAQHVIQGLYDNVTTTDIDKRSSVVCANLSVQNYEYGILAGRISVNDHHKNTLTSFKDKIDKLYFHTNKSGKSVPVISTGLYKFVKKNQQAIEDYIDYKRDYLIDFFGFKTLEKSYLLRINKVLIERPQDMFMRFAIFTHMSLLRPCEDVLKAIFETYDFVSKKYFTPATPTLFNSGLVRPQLASCFLLGSEDSVDGIFKTLSDCAQISKYSGGIGFHINWRCKDSPVEGTGGKSDGIIPYLKIYEKTALAVNQGGRRPGSFSPYLELHHPDIIDFLNLSRKNVKEEFKANKLYLALWVCDLFMKRVKNDEIWSTFCPNKCPGLSDCYGEEYNTLYLQYEQEGRAEWTKKARDIWLEVFRSQKESGFPYLVYKDAVNRCSNQKNIGVIKSSNLCSEIVEYSSSKEYAVCTLSSICLSRFVEDSYTEEEILQEERRPLNNEFPKNPIFNYDLFKRVIGMIVRNLNKAIDNNYYPVPETKRSNFKHRPIGIGVQGLADVFFKFNVTFDSPEAKRINAHIFETLYYTALSASCNLAREILTEYRTECAKTGKVTVNSNPHISDGGKVTYSKTEYTCPDDIPSTAGAYSTFIGSPLSEGIFHWEMMGLTPDKLVTQQDWNALRSRVQEFGVVNSLLIALMPTASTSQIMGNIECFEPLMSNIFIRNTLAGEFLQVNKYLIHDLMELGLWNSSVEDLLKLNNGSVQSIDTIPPHIKHKYRTVWEISQKHIIDLAADRSPFIDQSQSLNLHIQDLNFGKFNSMHMYGWSKGLKTGCYYLRSQEAAMAQKFTVSDAPIKREVSSPLEDCLACGS